VAHGPDHAPQKLSSGASGAMRHRTTKLLWRIFQSHAPQKFGGTHTSRWTMNLLWRITPYAPQKVWWDPQQAGSDRALTKLLWRIQGDAPKKFISSVAHINMRHRTIMWAPLSRHLCTSFCGALLRMRHRRTNFCGACVQYAPQNASCFSDYLFPSTHIFLLCFSQLNKYQWNR
jgi:hypothetical protein